jgi:hypothetical protein
MNEEIILNETVRGDFLKGLANFLELDNNIHFLSRAQKAYN